MRRPEEQHVYSLCAGEVKHYQGAVSLEKSKIMVHYFSDMKLKKTAEEECQFCFHIINVKLAYRISTLREKLVSRKINFNPKFTIISSKSNFYYSFE